MTAPVQKLEWSRLEQVEQIHLAQVAPLHSLLGERTTGAVEQRLLR